MSTNCNNNVVIPELISEECNGIRYSTKCIIHTPAIAYLGLSAGATQEQINIAFVNALIFKDQTITELTQRIETLENP